jgi:hypothetical protein
MTVHYPRRFFEINILFAQRIAEVSNQALDDALLNYTILYTRFGLGRDFDPANSTWQEYLGGLHRAKDLTEWTLQFYLARPAQADLPADQPDFGCFSYAVWPDNRIRLHFHNAETPENSPLSRHRIDVRLSELRQICMSAASKTRRPLSAVRGCTTSSLSTALSTGVSGDSSRSAIDFPFSPCGATGQELANRRFSRSVLDCLKARTGRSNAVSLPVRRPNVLCRVYASTEFERL